MRSVSRFMIGACTFVALLVPLAVSAQDSATFVPLANVEGSKLQTLYQSRGTLAAFVSSLFTMAISAGAILAVVRLSWAGFLYMTTDSWGSKGKAREVISDVVLGLLLLLGIWLILWQINPNILKLDFLNSLKPLQTSSPSGSPGANPSSQAVVPSGAMTGSDQYGCFYVDDSGQKVSVPCTGTTY